MSEKINKDGEILRLKKEIEKLKKNIKKQRYGLVWVDVPEAFEDDVENKLPILKEVPDLEIKSKDDKPQHILIEGDNYHALTCLNYTHKGKIDVIYIDPPYNTGQDGFRYKDKRILNKFPDGTEVPKDSPYRHSYWLSFMKKRLELAKDLLVPGGILFISIDNNEFAQLKLLCDEIFSENNFIEVFSWTKTSTPPGLSNKTRKINEFVLCYEKGRNGDKYFGEDLSGGDQPLLNRGNKLRELLFPKEAVFFKLPDEELKKGNYDRVYLKDDIKIKEGYANKDFVLEGGFKWTQKTLNKEIKNGTTFIVKSNKLSIRFIRIDDKSYKSPTNHIKDEIVNVNLNKKESGIDTNEIASKQLFEMFHKKVFDNPKPISLIKYLISFNRKKEKTILDFFAGSGSTGHAILELNNDNENKNHFILVTNNENQICEEVCYPRLKMAVSGYETTKKEKINGLGGSIKYYRTAFVGKNNILFADDKDKIELAHNAGELLAIAENTLNQEKSNKYFQIFKAKNEDKYTAVYFREELDKFDDFIDEVLKIKGDVAVYMFSWEDNEDVEEFEDCKNITVKTIPKPILEIYKQIYNLA